MAYEGGVPVTADIRAAASMLADIAQDEQLRASKGWIYTLQDEVVIELRRRGLGRAEIAELLGFASSVTLGVYLHNRRVLLTEVK